eukprot:61884_1
MHFWGTTLVLAQLFIARGYSSIRSGTTNNWMRTPGGCRIIRSMTADYCMNIGRGRMEMVDIESINWNAAHLWSRNGRRAFPQRMIIRRAHGVEAGYEQLVTRAKRSPFNHPKLLIVGLGNPGKHYDMTRHNMGYLVVDELARRQNVHFLPNSKFKGSYGSTHMLGKNVGLLKPSSFMNCSGKPLLEAMKYFCISLSNVLVLVDEVAFEFGRVRLRMRGSAGGHNGLKSIEKHLRTDAYPRLRIGVGTVPNGVSLPDHVMGRYSYVEEKMLPVIISNVADAVETWV